MFLADAFLSHVPEASCNVPAYRAWLDHQDFTPAYRHLRRMLQLLQWQKRRGESGAGAGCSRRPRISGYLDTLLATFPDAHVVHMHRDPVRRSRRARASTRRSGACTPTTSTRARSVASGSSG